MLLTEKKRFKLTAFGVTLGYNDTIENNTNYKTIIITKKQQKGYTW